MTNSLKTFEVGKTYTARSLCDYDCVFAWTVTARTAKQITLEDRHGRVSKRAVRSYDGVEVCSPQGRFSMSPMISAAREAF
jgi:hypothetical protein